MMRVALYIRVSTDEQASSAEEQERGARAWCERQGHVIVATYRDIGFSGAEWRNRPGVLDLEAAAKRLPRAFDLVVVRDADRLGRDAVRVPLLLATLAEHDVRAVAWSTGESLTANDGLGSIIIAVKAGIAQAAREQIAHTTRTAHRSRAERGMVTGGKVYGWDNDRSPDGVRYVVNEAEAAIVREMYERHATGESARTIARAFNARRIPSPRAEGGGSGSWCQRQVLSMLRSERYRGVATWGEVGSRYQGGTLVRVRHGEAELVRYTVPAIVSDELWQRAQRNSDEERRERKAPPRRGRGPKYFLIGHAICGLCNGPLGSARTSTGSGDSKRLVSAYTCLHARERGTCAARWYRPVERLDTAVADWMLSELLDAQVVCEAVARAREQMRARETGPDPRELELRARVEDLERRIARLVATVETADDVPELVLRLRERRRELEAAHVELVAFTTPASVVSLDAERTLLACLSDLRPAIKAACDENPQLARDVLGAVLVRPIRVTPEGKGRSLVLHLEGEGAPGSLLGRSESPKNDTPGFFLGGRKPGVSERPQRDLLGGRVPVRRRRSADLEGCVGAVCATRGARPGQQTGRDGKQSVPRLSGVVEAFPQSASLPRVLQASLRR